MSAPSPDRFHALDATRASALLLGVVFHAAWSFVPGPAGAPVVDESAHPLFGWFFFTSHTFRMQVFFLIAGFFARMLYQRRGFAGFVRHRLARIALPFVVGWVIFCPLVIALWTWGGNVSGGNIPELPLPTLFHLMYAQGLLFVPESRGGMFNLVHLWFLYYLIWILFLAVGVRTLLVKFGPVRRWADRAAIHLVRNPVALVSVGIGTGVFLWPMAGWNGVDTPLHELTPSLPVLLLYGMFFSLGWILHRQPKLLPELGRRWKMYLGAGGVLSVGCLAVFDSQARQGSNTAILDVYPAFYPNQVSDWTAFIGTLQSGASPTAHPELAALWQNLPAPMQTAIQWFPERGGPMVQAGICKGLTQLLRDPNLFSSNSGADAAKPAAGGPEVLAANRARLEALLGGVLSGDPNQRAGHGAVKLVYSIGYGLLMWLMVFASLGLFQAYCNSSSAVWRYVSDSAYWIYLAHLPLVAALQVVMGGWLLPAVVKFPLLLLIAFAVLFASYHYLVRSTIIGRLLNGQTHPFTPSPFHRRSPQPLTPQPVPVGAAAD